MVYMLLGTGFEETEAIAPLDILRRAGAKVLTVGIDGKTVCGSHGIPVVADITLEEMDITKMEMVVIPGGMGGVASLRACPAALEALRFGWENGKYVGAICAGPTVLADLGITEGRRATCYPGLEHQMGSAKMERSAAVVTDGRLITGTSAGCAIPFGLALAEALVGKEAAEKVKEDIVIR